MPTPQYIEFERKRLKITENSACSFQGRDTANRLLHEQGTSAWHTSGFPNRLPPWPEAYNRMRLDIPTVRVISDSLEAMGAPILLSDEHIAAAKAFVQELFDEGMDGVAVKVSQFNHSDDVEAFYLACDVEDGAVFLPKFFPTPVELISHELGHAVHHMLRRRSNPTDPAFWTGGQIEGELCAYYTQINYILEHGTRTQFYQALGALATFAAELVIDRATSSRLSLSDFLCDEDFAPYAGVSARDFVIRMFCALDRNFDKNGAKLFELRSSFPRGFGFALALKLIDERESMRNFMAIDSCSVPLDQKLSMAFPHRRNLDKLDDLPHVIARLAERLSD